MDYIGAYVRACSVAVSGKRSCPGDFQPPPDPYVSYVPGQSLFEAWLLLGFGPEVKACVIIIITKMIITITILILHIGY